VYNKYAKYPAYCSTPEEMEQRAVPPLQGNSNDGSSKLIHVTALIRHGARTPFGGAPRYQCWDGYWDNEETGIWNCDLKTYISPPAATKEKGQFVDGEGLLEEVKDQFFTYAYHDYHRFALLYLNHLLLHQTHFLPHNHFFSS